MLSARKTMDVVAAYRDVGTYRGAAEICGVDPKTVKRKVLALEAGELDEERARRASVPKNTDVARALVAQRVEATRAKITAKRLLVEARADGYTGSARNFRRLVGLSDERCNWPGRFVVGGQVVVLEESPFEGDGKCVEGGLPAVHPAFLA